MTKITKPLYKIRSMLLSRVDGYFIVNVKHQTSSTVKTSKMLKMCSFMRKNLAETLWERQQHLHLHSSEFSHICDSKKMYDSRYVLCWAEDVLSSDIGNKTLKLLWLWKNIHFLPPSDFHIQSSNLSVSSCHGVISCNYFDDPS